MSLGQTPPRPRGQSTRIALEDVFYCRPRRRRLSFSKCLEDYVNANAFAVKRSACWRCPQGCHNRTQYADSV